MKYYVVAIEQVYGEDGKVNEYMPKETPVFTDKNKAESKFHVRLGEIANNALLVPVRILGLIHND